MSAALDRDDGNLVRLERAVGDGADVEGRNSVFLVFSINDLCAALAICAEPVNGPGEETVEAVDFRFCCQPTFVSRDFVAGS
jgi:hypothetical protein